MWNAEGARTLKLQQETLQRLGLWGPPGQGSLRAEVTRIILLGVSLQATGSPELGIKAHCAYGSQQGRGVFSRVFLICLLAPGHLCGLVNSIPGGRSHVGLKCVQGKRDFFK